MVMVMAMAMEMACACGGRGGRTPLLHLERQGLPPGLRDGFASGEALRHVRVALGRKSVQVGSVDDQHRADIRWCGLERDPDPE